MSKSFLETGKFVNYYVIDNLLYGVNFVKFTDEETWNDGKIILQIPCEPLGMFKAYIKGNET